MESSTVPKVSVIIPLYNKAPYIKRALDSVLAQTVQDFEIVVVGGNSTDGGEDIVLGYSDSRIRFVKEAGKGVSAARNQGVDAARAELVAFLDADDEWLPEFLETVLSLWLKYPQAGLYTTSWSSSTKGVLRDRKYYGIDEDFEGIISPIFIHAALADGATFPGITSSTMLPKNIFLNLGGFREDCCASEDIDLWARISLYYQNAHSQRHLVIYYQDDQFSLVKNTVAYLGTHPFERSLVEMSESGVLHPKDYTKELIIYINSLNIIHANNWLSVGNKTVAIKYLINVRYLCLFKKTVSPWIRILIPSFLLPYARKIYLRIK